MKKIAVLSLAMFAFTLVAAPAQASFWGWGSSNDITVGVNNSGTSVHNDAYTKADTGDNSIRSKSGSIRTGDALAGTTQKNLVNTSNFGIRADCGCDGDITIRVNNTRTLVGNEATTKAYTGDNYIGSRSGHSWWFGGSSSINTGDAAALTDQYNDVNYTKIRIVRGGGVE